MGFIVTSTTVNGWPATNAMYVADSSVLGASCSLTANPGLASSYLWMTRSANKNSPTADDRTGPNVNARVRCRWSPAGVAFYPVHAQDRAKVVQLTAQVQEVTGEANDVAYMDQDYTGDQAPRRPRRTAFTWE
jgi:hypothetical protein